MANYCYTRSISENRILSLCIFILITNWLDPTHGVSYSNVTQLFTDKIDASSGYNTAVRPLLDQWQVLNVSVSFDIIAIVELNDINQKFIVNGFLSLYWTDEIIAWDPENYNYLYTINPYPKQLWRPRLILGNTLEDRDLFEDDYCPLVVIYNGSVEWNPGSLFPTSCKLNLLKYPFDQQTCLIELYSMGLPPTLISFSSKTTEVGTGFFTPNGEWEMTSTDIECGVNGGISFFQVTFVLKRRPGFFIMNIVVPVVLLSFLNILVFLIPVESGEKISYGITVLLALALFMSIVSEMLPRSSDTLPLVTIYLMVLLVISVCTVIMAILIVSFHHRDEKETRRLKAKSAFKGIFNKIRILNKAVTPLKNITPAEREMTIENVERVQTPTQKNTLHNAVRNIKNLNIMSSSMSPEAESDKSGKHHVNQWRIIGRYINTISFVVFMVIWASVTIGFVIEISS